MWCTREILSSTMSSSFDQTEESIGQTLVSAPSALVGGERRHRALAFTTHAVCAVGDPNCCRRAPRVGEAGRYRPTASPAPGRPVGRLRTLRRVGAAPRLVYIVATPERHSYRPITSTSPGARCFRCQGQPSAPTYCLASRVRHSVHRHCVYTVFSRSGLVSSDKPPPSTCPHRERERRYDSRGG